MSSPTLRPGDQLAASTCGTRVVVVRAPADRRPAITCGGEPMTPATSAPRARSAQAGTGTQVGKRYVDASGTVELLCVASGPGELSCDGAPMTVRAPKPLPASD